MKVGDTFPVIRGPGKPYKAHVVAIVDGCMVVYKWYGRHKQWWHYQVDHVETLKLLVAAADEIKNRGAQS